jgi:hypothetical protein
MTIAYAMALPWAIIAVAGYVSAGMPNVARSGGFAIIGMILMPPVIVAVTSILFPLSRRVICTCGWRGEYPIHPQQTDGPQAAP